MNTTSFARTQESQHSPENPMNSPDFAQETPALAPPAFDLQANASKQEESSDGETTQLATADGHAGAAAPPPFEDNSGEDSGALGGGEEPSAFQPKGAADLEGPEEKAPFKLGEDKGEAEGPARPNKTGMPDQLLNGLEALSGFDMSDVRVHFNSGKPAEWGAYAYAKGTEIHIGPGQEKYLPHEAWHVVQQKQGRVKPTTMMKDGTEVNDDAGLEKEADVMGGRAMEGIEKQKRNKKHISKNSRITQLRLPNHLELRKIFKGLSKSEKQEEIQVLKFLIEKELNKLKEKNIDFPLIKSKLENEIFFDYEENEMPQIDSSKLVLESNDDNLIFSLSKVILEINGDSQLGDPQEYKVPLKPNDKIKLQPTIISVIELFDKAASMKKDIEDIFGKKEISHVITRLNNAKKVLNSFFKNDQILTDYSGYMNEVYVLGTTVYSESIFLPSNQLFAGDNKTKYTLFHEAMHAGNSEILDNAGYVHMPGFKNKSIDQKLKNADHYTALAHRQLGTYSAEVSGKFVPKIPNTNLIPKPNKKTRLPVTKNLHPSPSSDEKIISDLSNDFRKAHSQIGQIYSKMLHYYKNPGDLCQAVIDQKSTAGYLNFWSTILDFPNNQRLSSKNPFSNPISQLDLALCEYYRKKCIETMHQIKEFPNKNQFWEFNFCIFKKDEEKKIAIILKLFSPSPLSKVFADNPVPYWILTKKGNYSWSKFQNLNPNTEKSSQEKEFSSVFARIP